MQDRVVAIAGFAGKSAFFYFCWKNWKTVSFFIIRCWKIGIPGFFKHVLNLICPRQDIKRPVSLVYDSV